jgi:hypothetical protein
VKGKQASSSRPLTFTVTARIVSLAIASIRLTGCATVGSDGGGPKACPPVIEYSPEFQARAAEELALLPERSAVVEMLKDSAVMREHARSWRSGRP